jgi:hypothetical protein
MTSLLLIWILFGQATPSEAHILKTFYLRDGASQASPSEKHRKGSLKWKIFLRSSNCGLPALPSR